MIVGWSLVNSVIYTPHRKRVEGMIDLLVREGKLPADKRICVGQTFLRTGYRGAGLAEKLIALLSDLTCQRYDLYLATALKANLPSSVFLKKKIGLTG